MPHATWSHRPVPAKARYVKASVACCKEITHKEKKRCVRRQTTDDRANRTASSSELIFLKAKYVETTQTGVLYHLFLTASSEYDDNEG